MSRAKYKDECWRPVTGFEHLYEVSNQGQVRSLPRYIPAVNRDGTGRLNRCRGQVLKGTPDRDGYLKVNLRNSLGNLRYDTRAANEADKRRWAARPSA